MNNTTTKRNLSLVAIFMAATLVVGTFAVTTTTTTATQTAFAFSKNKKGEENSRNGNTITALKCQNIGSASGFDTAVDQECENLICTHPGNNATCIQEGSAAAAAQQGNQTTPVKDPCEQCFTSLLSQTQINKVVDLYTTHVTSLADLCRILEQTPTWDLTLLRALEGAGVSEATARELIQCLLDAGIEFSRPG